jgi:hypothetical protein
MTIEQIIRNGNGRAHAWRVEREDDRETLYHYSTAMLTWNALDPHDENVLDWDLGWGSVSDQNGMNVAFRTLGLPYYYSRANGASIEEAS